MAQNNKQQGFTLIELMLAMAFFSSILLLATLLIMQTLNIYNKGITVKQINQVGRTLTEEIIRVGNSGKSMIMSSNCFSIDKSVYIWNVASADVAEVDYYPNQGFKTIVYRYDDAMTGEPVNFVKLSSANSTCATVSSPLSRNDVTQIVPDNIHIYDMETQQIAGTDLVRFSMLLGTFVGPGSDYNLHMNGSNYECNVGGIGNFCSQGSIDTVLYLPNGRN